MIQVLPSFGFTFNLRRYNLAVLKWARQHGCGQGLPLVHFSRQPEPFLSPKPTQTTQRVPQKVLTSRREVDECTPRVTGGARRLVRAPLGRAVQVANIKTRVETVPGFSA